MTWDGKKRCETFLIDWMSAENTPYNMEVSRLIFAGGIHRIYDPGCKFDCVPVLMGEQGSGKSTICHWLALKDEFYNSIRTISDQKGSEGILGVWICEIDELLAVLANEKAGSASEEAAKAFLTRDDEYYRQPYAKKAEHNPRQCIFIGTTNKSTFVTDKTGARRWFPIKVRSDASILYEREEECRNAILQAWAEMKQAYLNRDDLASPTPSKALLDAIREEQADIACEDWRVGIIEDFLQDKTSVCILQVWKEALAGYVGAAGPGKKESNELAEILVHQLGWERGGVENFGVYKKQKAFHKPGIAK